MHLLDLVLWFVFVVWIAAGLFSFWNITGVAILRPDSSSVAPPYLPRVSILLAARNEQEMLPATLDSLLKLDYPDFDVKGMAVQAIADFPTYAETALARLRPFMSIKTEVFIDRRTTQPLDELVAQTLLAIGSRDAKLMYLEWYYINAGDEYKDNNQI